MKKTLAIILVTLFVTFSEYQEWYKYKISEIQLSKIYEDAVLDTILFKHNLNRAVDASKQYDIVIDYKFAHNTIEYQILKFLILIHYNDLLVTTDYISYNMQMHKVALQNSLDMFLYQKSYFMIITVFYILLLAISVLIIYKYF